MSKFKEELVKLINKHSIENESDTPDFILAQYLLNCLAVFNSAVNKREDWNGREKNNGIIKGLSAEDHNVLTELFNKSDSCPNCKETSKECACMRNICNDCGEPVGNITFSVCDKCWSEERNEKKREERIKKIKEAFDTVLYKLSTEHNFIRNDKENRNRLYGYTQQILNHMNFYSKFGECYRIRCDETNNPSEIVDRKQIVCTINYFDEELYIEVNKLIVLDLYEPKEFFNKKCIGILCKKEIES